MFQVLAGEKKSRVITPTTIAASVAAHVLLLGGALYAAAGDAEKPAEVSTVIDIFPDAPPPPPAVVEPTPPPPPPPDQPTAPPVPGARLELDVPTEAPPIITPEPPGTPPINVEDYVRPGPPGNVIGPPPADATPPPPVAPRGDDYVPGEMDVEERPVLNRDGLARALERHYPTVLRDSRVSGRVVIEVIVDEDGRVRDGSARVVEASHPAFGEAALRAVDRFRFRPGRMAGVPVPVRVTIPIQWMVPN